MSNSWSMEHGKQLKDNSRGQKSSLGGEGKSVAPCSRRGARLGDIFMAGKPTLSYADFHHEITRDVEDLVPEVSGMQHRSETQCKAAAKEDEVVKYMSNVPSFLEKGKSFQEKALNVGVLDWGRLEKWQSSNRSMAQKPNGDSPASSSTSFFSTDGSSPHSSGGQSFSPACRMMHQHPLKPKGQVGSPSRQSPGHFPQSHQAKAYPSEFNPQNGHTLPRDPQKSQKSSPYIGSNERAHQRPFGAKQAPVKNREEPRPEKCKRAQHELKFNAEAVRPKSGLRLVEPKVNVSDQDCTERPTTVVLLLPKDQVQSCSDAGRVLHFSRPNGWVPAASERGSSSEAINQDESHGSECFNISQTCSLSSQDDSKEHDGRRGTCCKDEQSSQPSRSKQDADKVSNLPSRIGAGDKKELIPTVKSRSEVSFSAELFVRSASESGMKSRTPSPIHKFSHGMARMIRSASSRDNSPQRKPISKDNTSISWAEKAAAAVVSSEHSCADKVHGSSRARSSPLRRLLDPLLKTKSSHCIHPTEQLKYDSEVTAIPCKPQNDQAHRHSESAKAGSVLTSTSGSYGSCQNSKHGSSSFQAILRLAVKNGLPLFTFAVDKSGDILAATLKKPDADGNDPSGGLYTFFTICQIKRKNGIWPYQAPKKNDHDYVKNAVAYMKASDQRPSSSGQKSIVSDALREFSLFSLDVSQGDEPETELPPAKELAAVIVRPMKTNNCNPSKARSQECMDFLHSDSVVCSGKDSSSCNGALSTTVILPGGVHSVPSNGAVSTLTQRWRSGGSCDCGGWDLGCQMRIYSDKNELKNNSNSSKSCLDSDEFTLFSEAGQENHDSVLSMTPFRDSVYAVQFNSCFSMLQAFAICVAVIECKTPSGFITPSEVPDEPAPGLAIPELLFQNKASKQSHREAPSRYFTYPPNSPVGRV